MAKFQLEKLMGIYSQFVGIGNTSSPELPLLTIFTITWHHSHLLAATMNCTTFFILSILSRAAHLAVFCVDTISPS